jgi:hypothetical protein
LVWTLYNWISVSPWKHPNGTFALLVTLSGIWRVRKSNILGPLFESNKYHGKDRKSVVHTWEEIERIEHETYPSGTVIYGVHLREGNRSYHANGYVDVRSPYHILVLSAYGSLLFHNRDQGVYW